MSQHHFLSDANGRAVRVTAGYDRPLDELFLHVFDANSHDGDSVVFASLYEPYADWRNPRTLVNKLEELNVAVPRTLLPAIVKDQRRRARNKIVQHDFGRAPRTTWVR